LVKNLAIPVGVPLTTPRQHLVKNYEGPPEPLGEWQSHMNEQNREKFRGFLRHWTPKGLFVDIGCNDGQWTFGCLAAGFSRAVAVDYDAAALRNLREKAQKYGVTNRIQIVECRVVPGWNRRSNDEIGFNYLLEVIQRVHEPIWYLKMDIEGDEYCILTDSPDDQWMDDVSYLNLETHGPHKWETPESGICEHHTMLEWLISKGWDYRQSGNFMNQRRGRAESEVDD